MLSLGGCHPLAAARDARGAPFLSGTLLDPCKRKRRSRSQSGEARLGPMNQ
jgi:hypothetical protein